MRNKLVEMEDTNKAYIYFILCVPFCSWKVLDFLYLAKQYGDQKARIQHLDA